MTTDHSLTKRIAMYLVENDLNPSLSLSSDPKSKIYTIQRDLSYRRKLYASFYDHDGKGVEQAGEESYLELRLDPSSNDQFGFLIVDSGLKGNIDDPSLTFIVTGDKFFGESHCVELSRRDFTEKQKDYFQARFDSVVAGFYRALTRKPKVGRRKR
ncbi:MAG: hypothetical protein PHF67_01485 [Candidatus Nanoarchaeia archaeon]|nr:hypothetical protein [Candidatus Nanoarchaeia archaeon]